MSRNNLDRFINAQKSDHETALKEIHNGKKTSHWVWYIFPQLLPPEKTLNGKNITPSSTTINYAIKDLNEACDYLKNKTLRENYFSMLEAVHKKIVTEEKHVADLMGGFPDDIKLISSLTLFEEAAKKSASEETDPTLKKIHNDIKNHCTEILNEIEKQKKYRHKAKLHALRKHARKTWHKSKTDAANNPYANINNFSATSNRNKNKSCH